MGRVNGTGTAKSRRPTSKSRAHWGEGETVEVTVRQQVARRICGYCGRHRATRWRVGLDSIETSSVPPKPLLMNKLAGYWIGGKTLFPFAIPPTFPRAKVTFSTGISTESGGKHFPERDEIQAVCCGAVPGSAGMGSKKSSNRRARDSGSSASRSMWPSSTRDWITRPQA
jgi:hypothetical protein